MFIDFVYELLIVGSDPTDVTPSFDSDSESDDDFETPPEEMIEENKGVSIIETKKGVSLNEVVNMLENGEESDGCEVQTVVEGMATNETRLSNVNVKEEISPVVADYSITDREESTELKVDTQQFEDIKPKVVNELFLQQYLANSLYQEYTTMMGCQTACHNEEKYYLMLTENKERVVRRDIRNQQTSEKVETSAVRNDEEECVTNEAVISDDKEAVISDDNEAVISDDNEAVISDDKMNELGKDDEIKREEVELNRTLLEDTKPQQHTMYEQYLANSVCQSYQLLMEHKRLNDHEEAYQCIEAKKIIQDNEQTLSSHDEKEDASHISTSKNETRIENRMEENNGTGEIKENAIPDTIDAVPDTTDAVPDTTDAINDTTDAVPDTTDAVPDTTDAVPDTTDAVPDTTDDTTGVISDTIDAVPDIIDDTTDAVPDTTDATDINLPTLTDTTDAVPDATDDTTDIITDTTDTVDILLTLTDTKVAETTLIYNDTGVNTDATPTLTDVATNTQTITNYDISTNTVIIETKDTECLANIECSHAYVNTDISAFELLKQVHSNEKFLRMEEELRLKTIELNDEKSKRMVNDNLVSILQSDITSIQQRNIDESTTRIRMNGEIAELKVMKLL